MVTTLWAGLRRGCVATGAIHAECRPFACLPRPLSLCCCRPHGVLCSVFHLQMCTESMKSRLAEVAVCTCQNFFLKDVNTEQQSPTAGTLEGTWRGDRGPLSCPKCSSVRGLALVPLWEAHCHSAWHQQLAAHASAWTASSGAHCILLNRKWVLVY